MSRRSSIIPGHHLLKKRHIGDDVVGPPLNTRDPCVGNNLITMYSRSGSLSRALQTFEDMLVQDVVSWNALITAYLRHARPHEAINAFQHMICEGCIHPDHVTFVCILKSCSTLRQISKGRDTHSMYLLTLMPCPTERWNIHFCNALVDMYAKSSQLYEAQDMFSRIPSPDPISWNSLIHGYSEHLYAEEALQCFFQMQTEGLLPDAITLLCVLKACGRTEANYLGVSFHALIVIGNWIKRDIIVGYALVNMYAENGMLGRAQRVFDELGLKDVTSWNALIAGYIRHDCFMEAVESFQEMQEHGHLANEVTFLSILKAIGHVGDIRLGASIHKQVIKQGLLERNTWLGAALVEMYTKCSAIAKAKEVFDELFVRDVVAWNSLIGGYVENGCGLEALDCFAQMQNEGFSPDRITFLAVLRACRSSVISKIKGHKVYTEIEQERSSLMKNVVVETALMDMYGKHGELTEAWNLFAQIGSTKNVVMWTALISAYVRHGNIEDALHSVKQMQHEGITPNAITFVCILKACGDTGSIHKGKEAHTKILTQGGLLEKDLILGNTLVDMYMKCGDTVSARKVFDRMPIENVDSWNVLMTGYARSGQDEIVMNLCDRMIGHGVVPDVITFIVLLNVCNHSGLVDTGQMLFELMMQIYGILPSMQHYVSMVDLFGRSGQWDIALTLVNNVATSDHIISIWVPLLSACHNWGDSGLANLVFKHMIQLDEFHAAASYGCMSNVHVTSNNNNKTKTGHYLSKKS